MKQIDLVYYIIDMLRRLKGDMKAIRHQQSLILEFIGEMEVQSTGSRVNPQLIKKATDQNRTG